MSHRRGYGQGDDPTEEARRRHEAEEMRAWEEDRRATERMWREGEARRAQAKWERLRAEGATRPEAWRFEPLHNEGQRVVGYEAFLNDRRVGMLIQTPHKGMAVIAIGDDPGEATVHFRRAPGVEEIMDAYQRALEAGR